MARRAPFLLLALLTCLAVGSAAFSQDAPARLSRDDAREFAIFLLRERQPLAAREIAFGLLQADAEDSAALNILAQSELALGRLDAAEQAGRRAYRAAGGEDLQRFTAAFTVAEALSRQGKLTSAQLWLRRAGSATDDKRLENAARQVYRGVESANPWRITGSLNVAPSSNVNNGSENAGVTVGGLVFVNPAALPLKGTSVDTSLVIERSFKSDGRDFTLGFGARDTRVFLTSDSKNVSTPALRNDDFSSSAVELSFGTRFVPEASRAVYAVNAGLSRDWRGGEALVNTFTLSGTRSWVHKGRQQRRVQLGYSRQDRLDSDNLSANIWSLVGTVSRPVEGGSLALDAALIRTSSASALVANTAVSAGIGYAHGSEVLGVTPTLRARLTHRDYDDIALSFTSVRRDWEVELGLEVAVPDLSVLGFIPTVGITAERNVSSIPAYSTEQVGLRFGYRSSF
ncbi:MAG: tetratricopeptide repeat protein [Pseudomonadota bacterium]